MENIGQTMATVNEQMQRSSSSPQTSTTTIRREQHVALFQIINKSRMLNGWQTRTAQELDATIQTWGEIFNKYQIPFEAYPELYSRAFDVRQHKMQMESEAPPMDATLLVSCWTGQHGLKSELDKRRIEQGRTLGANVASVCKHCNGSGFREVERYGTKGMSRCNHEDL